MTEHQQPQTDATASPKHAPKKAPAPMSLGDMCRASPIVAINFRAQVLIGTTGLTSINFTVDKRFSIEVDHDERKVFIREDAGDKSFVGWTPFENVVGVKHGMIAKS